MCTDLYACDTPLYDVQNSMKQIETKIQIALDNLHVWYKENGMIINSLKTKVMLVTTSQSDKGYKKKNLILNLIVKHLIQSQKIKS